MYPNLTLSNRNLIQEVHKVCMSLICVSIRMLYLAVIILRISLLLESRIPSQTQSPSDERRSHAQLNACYQLYLKSLLADGRGSCIRIFLRINIENGTV